LPIAVANINIDELLKGASIARKDFDNADLNKNIAYQYAVSRYIYFKKEKSAEMLIAYEPQLAMFLEWWKQLFGESEGKEGKGLLPTSALFSTDLHSLGQFIQDGSKVLLQTTIKFKSSNFDLKIPSEANDFDQLNYLSGKSIKYINDTIFEATLDAHYNVGKNPNIIIELEKFDATNFGYLFYFMMTACAMSALLLDVNPFDQPGVEIYKQKMFSLLGKPQ